jgi:hypothetical protein
LRSSTATPFDAAAADRVRERIAAAASRLGVLNPAPMFGRLLDVTFARPPGDEGYARNRLQPGALPLEWSFSELEPEALRFEIQPFDTALAPGERLRCTVREMARLVRAHHSEAARFAARLDELVPDRQQGLTFGAFCGTVVAPGAAPTLKVYVEHDPSGTGRAAPLPGIEGAEPLFRCVSVGPRGLAERVYFLCREELRLRDLERLCAALGLTHRFPAMALAVLELTEGAFFLPPKSVLLGVRETAGAEELKIELVALRALSGWGLAGRVERLLAAGAVAPYRRWLDFVRPNAQQEAPIRIVSVRATRSEPPRLSVYAAEPAFAP